MAWATPHGPHHMWRSRPAASGQVLLLLFLSQAGQGFPSTSYPRMQLFRGPQGHETQPERDRPHLFLSKAKDAMVTEGTRLPQSLSRIGRRKGSYLAAMRKNNHHKAIQGPVVPACHLHQSCNHFLQRKATVKAGASVEI